MINTLLNADIIMCLFIWAGTFTVCDWVFYMIENNSFDLLCLIPIILGLITTIVGVCAFLHFGYDHIGYILYPAVLGIILNLLFR